MRFRTAVCAFILAAALPALAAFSERLVTRVDGVSIEADPADAEYVQVLIAKLRQPDPRSAPDPKRFGLAELRQQREAALDELSRGLALSAPTPTMREVFDKFSAGSAAIYDAMIHGRPTHYSLWRKPDLVARLQSGQIIPGFTLEGDEVSVALNANFEAPPGTPPEQLSSVIGKTWQQLVWPVSIGRESPAADVDAALRALSEFRQAATGAEVTAVMTVLHETVESTLVQQYLHSADRRWFCEGVANHLALKVIRQRVGAGRAREYYDVDALLAQGGAGSFADLARWPAAESAAHYSSEINQANYARATWVIEQVAAKHGPALIPKWLAEIGNTPADMADMNTVKAAFKKITGEDLANYLRGPAT